jgi:CelD/BcsL family acetyltransferase involved in cellulose biosynthesis
MSNGKCSTVPEFRVEVISDDQAFLDLAPVWNKLVEVAGIDHPFLTHEWIRTWWECFGAGKQLHILVVKVGAEVIAIAPLMLSSGRIYGCKVRRVQFLYNDHTPRCNFIVARWVKQAYQVIWHCLVDQQAFWDVMELCQLPAGSRTLKELPTLAAGGGFLVGLWRSPPSPYVPVLGPWESYFKRLKGNFRGNVQRRLKRLEQFGPVALEVMSSGEHLGSALEDGWRLEAAAWKGQAGTAINRRPELRRFYTRFAQRAAECGWLRLHFLTVDRHRIAFDYSLCYQNKLYCLKGGYDPQFAHCSPGKLLDYMILREAFERGLSEVDFLGEEDRWKLDWTSAQRSHYWLYVFPNVLPMRLLHDAKFRLVPRLKQQRPYVALRDAIMGLGSALKSVPRGTTTRRD